jgi:hypothetical protein
MSIPVERYFGDLDVLGMHHRLTLLQRGPGSKGTGSGRLGDGW